MNTNVENKKPALVHPLWTHLPAVAALAAFIIILIIKSPLPARAPLHYNFQGVADTYGSPWSFVWIIIGLSVFFIGLSIFLDELWSRTEKMKRYNWLTILDDIVVGWLAGMGIAYLNYLPHWQNNDGLGISFVLPILMTVGVLALSLIVEAFRPHRPYNYHPAVRETGNLAEDVKQQIKIDSRFAYWDNQNPAWLKIITIALPVLLLVLAGALWFTKVWVFYELVLIGLLLLLPNGGQRIMVTRDELAIRWGLPGFRVLRLKTADIIEAQIMEFSALADFGGFGIRFGRGMTAYFLRGSRGVAITMANGKKYLLGSDNPEELLEVVRAVSGPSS